MDQDSKNCSDPGSRPCDKDLKGAIPRLPEGGKEHWTRADPLLPGIQEEGNEVLYNKGNMQYMAQMLLNTDDPNILAQAQLALDEANEACDQQLHSDYWIPQEAGILHTDSEAGSITGFRLQPKGTGDKPDLWADPGVKAAS